MTNTSHVSQILKRLKVKLVCLILWSIAFCSGYWKTRPHP